ncbi:MAG: hypothetical protein R3301_12020 [Saprospiraceae bacterium]|nr:hypothetical protein [Saprospiraceae bacterium]
MLEHWIKPVDEARLAGFFIPPEALGQYCRFELNDRPDGPMVALIGADPKWAGRVRSQLYQFAARSKQGIVCDLGDFRQLQPEFVIPALHEVLAGGICPVIVGARPDLSLTLMHAIRQSRTTPRAVFLHEQIPGWLMAVPEGASMQVIGAQQHLMHTHTVAEAERLRIGSLRLGQSRNDLAMVEPLIRDAEVMGVDMSALRYSDMPAQTSHSTSGFTTEEACQMMRYAGMSPSLRGMALTGHDPMSAAHGVSANTVAQMIWYFIDGFVQRIHESPRQTEHFTRYLVHLKDYDFDLSFHKSEKSGRWWVEVPGKAGPSLHSCSYKDYQAACEDVVTERIFACLEPS